LLDGRQELRQIDTTSKFVRAEAVVPLPLVGNTPLADS
jgi:hypothetical protein